MRGVLLFFVLLASACATAAPINTASDALGAQIEARAPVGDDLIVLALSGGGARAASFHLGVLQGLRATPGHDGRPLSEHIVLITSVSGGSVLAAYYGLHGEAGLDTFRAAYLDKNWRLNSLAAPTTWWSALRGGANGPSRHAEWLDREVYGGALMGAMGAGPRVVINATDLYNATPFAFTPLFFDGVCSDLGAVRVADAVAASMAVPLIFRPVLVQTHQGCAESEWVARVLGDRAAPVTAHTTAQAFRNYRGAQSYLHLMDGGVFDNFGVASLAVMRAAGPAPAPLTAREAVQARRIVFLVVNAEYERIVDWPNSANGPGGGEALISALDAATEAGKRGALDALRASLDEIQRDLVQYRCGLERRTVRELRGPGMWTCEDLTVSMEVITLEDAGADAPADLINTPTLVSLPRARVDELIAGGRVAVTANEVVRGLAR